MESVKKSYIRRNCLYLFLLIFILILLSKSKEISILTIIILLFLFSIFAIKQINMYYTLKIIYENKIINLPSNNKEIRILSTFGLLLGKDIYKWGFHGINGNRLQKIIIDDKFIYINFGKPDKIQKITCFHGIKNTEDMQKLQEEIIYETGAEVNIIKKTKK